MDNVDRDAVDFEFLLEQLTDDRRAVGRFGGTRDLHTLSK